MKQDVTNTSVLGSVESRVWEDLVIAMLAVGGFTLEKVMGLRDSLARAGLLNPRNLSSWDEARVTRELTAAGYERGLLTGMYAERLTATMRVLAADDSVAESEAVLTGSDDERVAQLLLPQKGIGPKVVNAFLGLRRIEQTASEHGRR